MKLNIFFSNVKPIDQLSVKTWVSKIDKPYLMQLFSKYIWSEALHISAN